MPEIARPPSDDYPLWKITVIEYSSHVVYF
jgi:hypothetical protein